MVMSQNDSDNEYEEDYEDEFEPEGSGDIAGSPQSPRQQQASGPREKGQEHAPEDATAAAEAVPKGDTEVVSLEEYMKRLEDMPGGDGDDDDGNDIMDSITRGLDGLSPSPSARGKGSKYGGDPEEDSDDAILKKFNVQLSPRSKDKVCVHKLCRMLTVAHFCFTGRLSRAVFAERRSRVPRRQGVGNESQVWVPRRPHGRHCK